MIIDGKQIKEKYLNKIKEEITGKKSGFWMCS